MSLPLDFFNAFSDYCIKNPFYSLALKVLTTFSTSTVAKYYGIDKRHDIYMLVKEIIKHL